MFPTTVTGTQRLPCFSPRACTPELVQELLVDADVSITRNTYSHVIPSMGGRTASAMEDLLEETEE